MLQENLSNQSSSENQPAYRVVPKKIPHTPSSVGYTTPLFAGIRIER